MNTQRDLACIVVGRQVEGPRTLEGLPGPAGSQAQAVPAELRGLNEPRHDEPQHVLVMPLVSMTDDQRNHFEAAPDVGVWPEVGSRAMQRILIADEAYDGRWITVQDGRYRFLAVAESSLMDRGVISKSLAFEVIWK